MTANEFYASLSGKRITFVGVGRSNLPLIEQFKAHGAAVSVRDKRSEAALGEDGEALKKLGAKLICGEDYLESIDEDMLFRAPGVPYLLPELQKARANGVAVTSEMEVFFRPVSVQNLRRDGQRRQDDHNVRHCRNAESGGQDRAPRRQHRPPASAGDP